MPSASKLQLAATCPGSAVLPRVREESDAANAGTWKHSFVAAVAGGATTEAALVCVPEEWRAACRAVDVDALAPYLASLSAEVALAYDVETGRARLLGQDLERRYGDLQPAEVPMSLDYAGVVDGRAVVVDLKTGRGRVPSPARNWQLGVAALALARLHSVEAATVALALAPEDEEPRWVSAELDAFDLEVWAERLRGLRASVAAAGAVETLTIGDHCRWCPARFACPAQVDLVRRLATDPAQWADETRELLTRETAGTAWHRIRAVRRLLDGMEAVVFALAGEAPVPLGGGVELRAVSTVRELVDGNLARPLLEVSLGEWAARALEIGTSKAAIRRAVQASGAKGIGARVDAILEQLRAAGAVTERESTRVAEVEESTGRRVKAPPRPAESTSTEPPLISESDLPF